jgi:hypothetical protein
VDESWALVFAGYDFALAGGGPGASATGKTSPPVADLVHSYRELGHLIADVNPLDRSPRRHPLLELGEFGFEEADLNRVVDCAPFRSLGPAPLRELATALRETYGGTLGVEYLMISDKAQREWLQERMEPARNRPELGPEDRVGLLERLIAAEAFEQFLHTSYVGQKRFSLEGGEALIPLLDTLVEATGVGPAEKTGGAPVTITTRVDASSRSSANAAPRSVSMSSLSELRRSGRSSVTVAIAPSRVRRTLPAKAYPLTLSSPLRGEGGGILVGQKALTAGADELGRPGVAGAGTAVGLDRGAHGAVEESRGKATTPACFVWVAALRRRDRRRRWRRRLARAFHRGVSSVRSGPGSESKRRSKSCGIPKGRPPRLSRWQESP